MRGAGLVAAAAVGVGAMAPGKTTQMGGGSTSSSGLKERGHVFFGDFGDGIPRTLVNEILQLLLRSDVWAKVTPLTGGHQEINLFEVFPEALQQQLLARARQLCPELAADLVFHQLKALIGTPGALEQVPHKDSRFNELFSMIVHLTGSDNPAKPLWSTRVRTVAVCVRVCVCVCEGVLAVSVPFQCVSLFA